MECKGGICSKGGRCIGGDIGAEGDTGAGGGNDAECDKCVWGFKLTATLLSWPDNNVGWGVLFTGWGDCAVWMSCARSNSVGTAALSLSCTLGWGLEVVCCAAVGECS